MLLTILIFMPLVFVPCFFFIKEDFQLKYFASAAAFSHFIYSIFILCKYDFSIGGYQLIEKLSLFKPLGFYYGLGVDGLSLCLCLLSTFLFLLALLGTRNFSAKNLKGYFASLFLIQTAVIGTFLAIDMILFYMFFEASLIPMLFLIGIWGGSNRVYAAKKFFLYTFISSIFLLGAILTLIVLFESVNGVPSALFADLETIQLPFVKNSIFSTQTVLFFGFLVAFAVKTPLFPLHTWLPDAHVEAPTMGSVLLAGLMLKMGTYGVIRFVPTLFPQASEQYAWLICALALIGIVYGALVSFAQVDMKKLVAYSSVSHMGYIILGIFSFNIYGSLGSSFQMISHGLNTGALFLLIGFLYSQTKTRNIEDYGGLASVIPRYTVIFLLVTFASVAVPLTNGFIGEFLILRGAFEANPLYGVVGVLGVILSACYMLHMVKRIFYGKPSVKVKSMELEDLKNIDFLTYVPILILVFFMGIYPKPILDRLDLRIIESSSIESEAGNNGE